MTYYPCSKFVESQTILTCGVILNHRSDLRLYVVDGASKRVLTAEEVLALLGEEFLRSIGIEAIAVRLNINNKDLRTLF